MSASGGNGAAAADDRLESLLSRYPSIQAFEYEHESKLLRGYVGVPSLRDPNASPVPLVIVAHTAIGPQEDFILSKVRALTEAGVVAFACDCFGAPDLVFGQEKEECNRQFKENRKLLQSRMQAGLSSVCSSSDFPCIDETRVAAIGYCFGGKAVLDLCRAGISSLKGVVSFHGILDHPRELDHDRAIETKVLAFNGFADPYVPAEKKQAFMEEMEVRPVL